MHSHFFLADIFLLLWENIFERGGFVDMIFRLVLFHQSLDGANDFPPMVSLSKEERLIYCDERFFQLMKVLMVCDSQSYMFVMDADSRMDRCIGEFHHSNKLMTEDWDEKYKLLKYHIGRNHHCC